MLILDLFLQRGKLLRKQHKLMVKQVRVAEGKSQNTITMADTQNPPPYVCNNIMKQMPAKEIELEGRYTLSKTPEKGQKILYPSLTREEEDSEYDNETEEKEEQTGYHRAVAKKIRDMEKKGAELIIGPETTRTLRSAKAKDKTPVKDRVEWDPIDGEPKWVETPGAQKVKFMKTDKSNTHAKATKTTGVNVNRVQEKGHLRGRLTLQTDMNKDLEETMEEPEKMEDTEEEEREDEEPQTSQMQPLIAKGRQIYYQPFPNVDIDILISKLPRLEAGANKWILILANLCEGKILSLGDIKAILARTVGVLEMYNIFESAELANVARTQTHDADFFNNYKEDIWQELRRRYPLRISIDSISLGTLNDTDDPMAFIHQARREWITETGNMPEVDNVHSSMFRRKIIQALPGPIQDKLLDTVGIFNMTFEMFTDNVTHVIQRYREQKQKLAKQDGEAIRKLTQLQIQDKQDEKKRIQAVMTMQPQQQTVTNNPNNEGRRFQGPAPYRPGGQFRPEGSQPRRRNDIRCINCEKKGPLC
ncbi:uncharacterized protein LOC121638069 isoform X2 [Melanotaenia boesemani]|uniref:uncharacterized protein LOC121638069 isoform X2 n=1 Tax=Melanotaenia boesemani TaxID=1250792 RepID=UPI001C042F46|nr:uncharacterized protein LOC121638069 isoform X2 [Melanotaenia boesemani]